MVPPLVAPSATPQRFIGHASAILCNHRALAGGATSGSTIVRAPARGFFSKMKPRRGAWGSSSWDPGHKPLHASKPTESRSRLGWAKLACSETNPSPLAGALTSKPSRHSAIPIGPLGFFFSKMKSRRSAQGGPSAVGHKPLPASQLAELQTLPAVPHPDWAASFFFL